MITSEVIVSTVLAAGLVGAGSCFAAQVESEGDGLHPRDLSPVTRLSVPKHAPVEIVRDGKARAVVYVADPAGRKDWTPKRKGERRSTLRRLVDELDDTIRLSTGAALEFVTNAPPAGRAAIVIGDCEETRKAGIDAGKLPPEGFEVRTASNRVYLVGSTQALPPGIDLTGDGTAWAVADFLERFVDVRWYWPTAVGGRTITPRDTLTVPAAHYSDAPAFRQREYHPVEGWKLPSRVHPSDNVNLPFAPGAIPDGVMAIDMASYLPLVRGGNSWPYKLKCHEPQNLQGLPQAYRDENADMFELKDDGTRNFRMFCYSSQKALDYLLAGCERTWDQNKGASWVTATCVTVSPGDSRVECHCPDCLKTIAAGGGGIDGTSRVLALFVKRMCEAVKARWPDKKVIYLPYWNYQECPKDVDYPDNLTIMVAMTTYPLQLSVQPENFEEALERIRVWRGKSSTPITTWDYCVAWSYGAYQYPHVIRDHHKAIKGLVAGTFINGWTLGEWTITAPSLYVWMKALWNPELDVDDVFDEMCSRLYGKAGGTVRELMQMETDLWENGAWRTERVKVPGGWAVPESLFPRVWTPEIAQQMTVLRDRALVELADDPVGRQRFLYWTWTFDAFLKDVEKHAQKE